MDNQAEDFSGASLLTRLRHAPAMRKTLLSSGCFEFHVFHRRLLEQRLGDGR